MPIARYVWINPALLTLLRLWEKVVVHEASTDEMNFQAKNFRYVTKAFGDFLDQITEGQRQYLRSLASEKPAAQPAQLIRDFPEIAEDFTLPPELALVIEQAHSSPLRISGPVALWLHYDVSSILMPCHSTIPCSIAVIGDGECPLPDSGHQAAHSISTFRCHSIALPCGCL